MNGVLERTLGILELLSRNGMGMEMAALADQLNIPRSAVHRLLSDLQQFGYVRQTREHGDYVLTTKLVSLGLSFLGNTGITDVAQPLLDRLADVSGELVRLAVVDGTHLTWVARAQGARQGLRYDPDMGSEARLSCSSSGLAWMSALPDEEALALVAQQGVGPRDAYGPNAATSLQDVLAEVHAARARGFSLTEETYTAGLNAMAVPVMLPGERPLGAITVAGPTARFNRERMLALAPELLAVAAECARASRASPFFNHAHARPRAAAQTPSKPIYAE